MSRIHHHVCLCLSAGFLLLQGCDTALDIASGLAAENNSSNATPDDASDDSMNTETDSTLETEISVCGTVLSGSSFQIQKPTFCGFNDSLYWSDDDNSIDISMEDEDTLMIENWRDEPSSCTMEGCAFECDDIVVGVTAADGYNPENGEDAWSTTTYSMALSGVVGPNGIRDVEAIGAVECSGFLCREQNCEGDLSPYVTWQPSSDN